MDAICLFLKTEGNGNTLTLIAFCGEEHDYADLGNGITQQVLYVTCEGCKEEINKITGGTLPWPLKGQNERF